MAAAGALGVVGVNGTAAKRRDGVLDKAGLVQRIRVNGHLHVVFLRHAETAVDGGRRRTPILMQFQAQRPGFDLLAQRLRQRAVTLAHETEVDRVLLRGLQHAVDVPRSRCARGGVRAGSRAGAAAQHGGDAGDDGLGYLLRADEMNVRVDTARRHDHPLTRDDLGVRPHHQLGMHTGH